MKVLITGANGFIGQALCSVMHQSGFTVRSAVRQKNNKLPINCEIAEIGDIGPETDWQKALAEVDIVIHLAGRAHILGRKGDDSLAAFRKVNVLGTERLARTAAKSGVKRFIFISSVKVNPVRCLLSNWVNGDGAAQPYTEKDTPAPKDAYAISKMEAEDVLTRIAYETGLEIVILRLPLVYGPRAKANFKNLIKLTASGLPLPFKSVANRRSFLYIGNLTDAIITCAAHPLAKGGTFMVSDGEDVSTPELIKTIATAMNRKPRLFYLPSAILKVICKIAGMDEELEKLTGTLFVDSSKIRNLLGWRPPFTMGEGIKETVKG